MEGRDEVEFLVAGIGEVQLLLVGDLEQEVRCAPRCKIKANSSRTTGIASVLAVMATRSPGLTAVE